MQVRITRADLEAATAPLLERTLQHCRDLLRTARLHTRDVTDVLLVGGVARMPRVLESVRAFFRREPYRAQAPEESVVLGAALLAALQARAHSASMGSRAAAAAAAGGSNGPQLAVLERAEHSVGVEAVGGRFVPLIHRDSPLPARATVSFTTHMNAQRLVNVFVYAGEDPIADRNTLLGTFDLDGVRPAPRGVPNIEIELALDASGLLHAQATDVVSGARREMRVSVVRALLFHLVMC